MCGGDELLASRLEAVHAAIVETLRAPLRGRSLLSSTEALSDYVRVSMGFSRTERLVVLHLNARNVLLREEIVSEGTIDATALPIREVVARALELGSAALILVHNHPSGDPVPSRHDVSATRALIEVCRHLGIEVHDHIVVGSFGYASMRALRLL